MADAKISQLTGVTTPLAGTEVLPIVQSGSTKKVTVDQMIAAQLAANIVTESGTTRTLSAADNQKAQNLTNGLAFDTTNCLPSSSAQSERNHNA